ncbi:MFS transporter [bacterium]|nr:MFS transporter [bacterium]
MSIERAIHAERPPTLAADGVPASPVQNVYNRTFWLCFAANFSMVCANALTFRFAELVTFLGGSEMTTGEIIQVGMIGALASRLFLGQLLDRYGTRLIWSGASLLFVVSCLTFVGIRELNWMIYAARIGFAVSIAGMSTAGILYIQNQVPGGRRTEVIGNFGSSGFLGMVVGSQLGDLIFWVTDQGAAQFRILFGAATGLAVLYLALSLIVTHGDGHERPHETPHIFRLMRRHWPGVIVLAAMMMGVNLSVATVFLTRMTTTRGLGGIGTFFLGYCLSAFCFRVASASWASRFGRHRLILMGLSGHAIGHVLLAFCQAQWHLIVPALCCGFGHALLFPSVVSLGSGGFPRQYRGTGTTIVLGFTEVGVAISAPALGWLIDTCREHGVADPFVPMFLASATSAVVAGIIYFLATRNATDELQQSVPDGD